MYEGYSDLFKDKLDTPIQECKHMISVLKKDFFSTYIQPIFSLKDLSTYGYEILNRPTGIPTEQYYDEIVHCQCCKEIDNYLLEKSLCVARLLPGPTFVNVFPSTLLTLASDLVSNNIVFELNERELQNTQFDISSIIREKSLNVAIDDVCKGTSGIRALIEMSPSFIKLDKWLISDIASSKRKWEFVRFLVNYSAGRSKLIAEGIESSKELDVVRNLGIDYAQGYLLSRPQLFK
jgi:EAL domain-containing protein (putative c-di-GMP-specific phosphodiesterase class I)